LIERKDTVSKILFWSSYQFVNCTYKHFRFFKRGGSYLSENKVSLVSRNLRVK